MADLTKLPLLLSVDQAVSALGLSRSVFYRHLMRGDIVSVMSGKRRFIPRDALQDYVDRLLSGQTKPSGQRKLGDSKEAVTN